MAKYIIKRPWVGVKAGDAVDIKELHPAIKSRVEKAPADKPSSNKVTVATPNKDEKAPAEKPKDKK